MIVIRIFYVNYFEKINLKFKLGFRIYDDYLW